MTWVSSAPAPLPVYCGDDIDDLLDFSPWADELSPAFGPVHHCNGEYRWVVLDPESIWPSAKGPFTDRQIINALFVVVIDPRFRRGLTTIDLDVCGWMFTGAAPAVADPTVNPGRHRRCLISHYLDVDSGVLSTRIQNGDFTAFRTRPRPAAGWGVSVPAVLDICRMATAPPAPVWPPASAAHRPCETSASR